MKINVRRCRDEISASTCGGQFIPHVNWSNLSHTDFTNKNKSMV